MSTSAQTGQHFPWFQRGNRRPPAMSSRSWSAIMGSLGMPRDMLVVEDDPIIALGFEDTLLSLGVAVVRVAGSVAGALEMVAERLPDFALLDVSLTREKSFAVAERLQALGIPFAFVTGYGNDLKLPVAFADKPRLAKPCSTEALLSVLKR